MAVIQLANPWALLALGGVPLIIILHALRPQRRQIVVSTISLWHEALVHRKRGFGLQKLRKDLSLLLLLLIAAALGLGLADPHWITASEENNDIVLVLDVSASMQAKGAGLVTRFRDAQRQAGDIIDKLSANGRALLIASARNAVLLTAFETDRELLQRRLSDLTPTDEVGRPRDALTLALSLLRNRDHGKVYFLTDGAFDDDVNLGSERIEFRLVAGGQHNVAITRFDFRPEIGVDDRFQVLVTIQNYSGEQLSIPLQVTLREDRLLDEAIVLAAFEQKTLVRAFRGVGGGLGRAVIDYNDDLDADNEAFATVGADQPLRVALFTAPEGSFYLETVFRALPNTHISSFDLFQEDLFVTQIRNHDVMVFDGVPPPELPPGSYLLIDTIAPGLPFTTDGWVTRPVIESQGDSALVRTLDFTGISIERARRVVQTTESSGLQRLFWSAETDLALALIDDHRRVIYLGFNPAASSFPLHAAFPLFLSESLAWLHPRENRFSRTQVSAGVPFTLQVPVDMEEVRIIDPSGDETNYRADNGLVAIEHTSQRGFYQYEVAGVSQYFAVNLTSSGESDISARAIIPQPPQDNLFNDEGGRVASAVWSYLAGFALLALLLEWWFWCGRRTNA